MGWTHVVCSKQCILGPGSCLARLWHLTASCQWTLGYQSILSQHWHSLLCAHPLPAASSAWGTRHMQDTLKATERLARGHELIARMKGQGIRMEEVAYTAMARMAAAAGQPDQALAAARQLLSARVPPKLRVFVPALRGYCAAGDAQRAFEACLNLFFECKRFLLAKGGLGDGCRHHFNHRADAIAGHKAFLGISSAVRSLAHARRSACVLQNTSRSCIPPRLKKSRCFVRRLGLIGMPHLNS